VTKEGGFVGDPAEGVSKKRKKPDRDRGMVMPLETDWGKEKDGFWGRLYLETIFNPEGENDCRGKNIFAEAK